jgi:hypothetical protein
MSLAVFNAALFCAHVVPVSVAGELAVFIFAKRDCISPSWCPSLVKLIAGGGAIAPGRDGSGGDAELVLTVTGGDAVVIREGGGRGGVRPPISKPGTDTPA